jgi:insertion element IS1 protein InsB
LRRILEGLSRWEVTVYCTDHWEAYAAELDGHPDRFHVATKAETVHIERNNSDNRRWLGRFQRKSKVVSKSF